METVSWTYVLLSLGSVALISGAVLGYLFGFRAGGRRERFIQVKEKNQGHTLGEVMILIHIYF